jgi:hypothetical protein
MAAGQLPSKRYTKSANVCQPETLEVVAQVNVDGTLFVVSGDAIARHQDPSGNWMEFGNVYERDDPLGVFFVNDQELSLDDVFEEATAIRNQYCTSVQSTAAGLKASHANQDPSAQQQSAKGGTSEAKVGTEDMKGGTPEKAAKQAPPPEASSDILLVFMRMILGPIISFVWFVLITLPFQVFSWMVSLFIAICVLSIMWLYFADDHGAGAMGAGMNMYCNTPGIL